MDGWVSYTFYVPTETETHSYTYKSKRLRLIPHPQIFPPHLYIYCLDPHVHIRHMP